MLFFISAHLFTFYLGVRACAKQRQPSTLECVLLSVCGFAAAELAVEEHLPGIFPFSEVMKIKIILGPATDLVYTLQGRRRSLSTAGNGTLIPL
jgi:hypothetical protein